MAITLLQPLAVGNAVRVFITPAEGWLYWRVLRRTADQFFGADDEGAVLVADGTDNVVLDTIALVNGQTYFYHAFGWNGADWVDGGPSLSVVPDARYADPSPDPQSIVRERVELGLAVEIARGNLVPDTGEIRVVTAPFGLPDIPLPAVSVHLETSGPAERLLGEMEFADAPDGIGGVDETDGWLARTTLAVVGVSLNSDERIELRKSIARVIKANLPVFDGFGMVQIEFSQSDTEQFAENNTPLYYTNGTFTCLAPSFIRNALPAVQDVTVTVSNE